MVKREHNDTLLTDVTIEVKSFIHTKEEKLIDKSVLNIFITDFGKER